MYDTKSKTHFFMSGWLILKHTLTEMFCVNTPAFPDGHVPGSLIRASSLARTAHTHTHTRTPAISLMCREARESRGNMSICCCDWQHFSQIYPAQPAGSQEESGEKGKGGERDLHFLSLSLTHTHTHTHAQADSHKKEQLCTVSWQVNSVYYTCF